MSDIKLKMNCCFSYTNISNVFIDEYMANANPVFVSIYIYGLRMCIQGINVTTKEIAEKFRILESDVINAWRYWNDNNIVKMTNSDKEVNIEFIEPKSKLDIIKESKQIKSKNKIEIGQRPKYTADEIAIYNTKNSDVKQIFSMAERILAITLNHNDMSILLGLYDWLRMPMDLIAVLFTYCASLDKRNIRYVEKVAIEWTEKGIDSVDKADEHIKFFNVDYKEIMGCFGIRNRLPIDNEQEYMNRWLSVYKMPIEIIKEACSKTILQTGQVSFKYADRVISKWFEKGVKTIDDVKKEEEEFKNEKKKSSEVIKYNNSKPYIKPNRFINYEQREWDFDELRKLERKLLDKEVEG